MRDKSQSEMNSHYSWVEFMKNENIQVEEWNTGVGKPEPGGSKE
jgi:hypothetical protein